MKRRQFIGIATAGTAALVWPAATRGAVAAQTSLAHPHLLEVLRNDAGVRALGLRYRERVPDENSSSVLEQKILTQTGAMKATALRARVKEEVQLDFARGRTVMLNGWVLSVTEARQCALFSLLPA